MNRLKSFLQEYKQVTEEIIVNLQNEEYDQLEMFFSKRQKVIDHISELTYTKEDFAKLVEELNLLNFEKKLEDEMTQKNTLLKENIKALLIEKQASKVYNNLPYQTKTYFNKKF